MTLWQTLGWRGGVAAVLAGGLMPLALAPYSLWPLGMLSCATLAILLSGCTPTQALQRSWLFGLGMFGTGASWIYISIHDFGFTGPVLATVMTALFVGLLASVFCLPFYVYARWLMGSRWGFVFGFSAIWVLGEWLRSWLFTGFPWLYIGYAHVDTWLAGWAPVIGVYGLSLITIVSGNALAQALYEFYAYTRRGRSIGYKGNYRFAIVALSIVIGSWLTGKTLQEREWTEVDLVQKVAIIQPNIELAKKWNPYYFPSIMAQLDELTARHDDADIQVWPEAAIPSLYHDVADYADEVDERARQQQTNIYSGVLYDDLASGAIYNGIIGLGLAEGLYFKQKLVPFGEYVPFEKQLRGLIEFFDLPNSVIQIGPYRPHALHGVNSEGLPYETAAFICYEVVYPDFVAANSRDAAFLLTISNDAWFGDSIGPLQHFQMARMRALENGKAMIRATNTGISAIIDARGQVRSKTEQFQQTTLAGELNLRRGTTPFSRFGSSPILIICALMMSIGVALRAQQQRRSKAR